MLYVLNETLVNLNKEGLASLKKKTKRELLSKNIDIVILEVTSDDMTPEFWKILTSVAKANYMIDNELYFDAFVGDRLIRARVFKNECKIEIVYPLMTFRKAGDNGLSESQTIAMVNDTISNIFIVPNPIDGVIEMFMDMKPKFKVFCKVLSYNIEDLHINGNQWYHMKPNSTYRTFIYEKNILSDEERDYYNKLIKVQYHPVYNKKDKVFSMLIEQVIHRMNIKAKNKKLEIEDGEYRRELTKLTIDSLYSALLEESLKRSDNEPEYIVPTVVMVHNVADIYLNILFNILAKTNRVVDQVYSDILKQEVKEIDVNKLVLNKLIAMSNINFNEKQDMLDKINSADTNNIEIVPINIDTLNNPEEFNKLTKDQQEALKKDEKEIRRKFESNNLDKPEENDEIVN